MPRFADAGVDALVVTEIARDGTFSGPDLDGLAAVLARPAVAVIASGGVGTLADLEALAALEVERSAPRRGRSSVVPSTRVGSAWVTPWLRLVDR